MLAFCLMAPLLDACSKLATDTIPVGQITAARFLFQAVCMAPFFLYLRPRWQGTRRDVALILARALCLVGSTYCFIAAIDFMPIADALAIVFIMPFAVIGLSRLIFGTPITRTQLGACAVSFVGALLIIQPSLSAYGIAALFPLGCALCFAFYQFATQAMADRVDPVTMQLHTALAGTGLLLPLLWIFDGSGQMALDPVMPSPLVALWLFGVGFWASASHFCMTLALRHAPASALAPLNYFELPMAVFLGYAIFGDFPNALTWAGMALITGSGLWILKAAHRTGRAEPTAWPDEAV